MDKRKDGNDGIAAIEQWSIRKALELVKVEMPSEMLVHDMFNVTALSLIFSMICYYLYKVTDMDRIGLSILETGVHGMEDKELNIIICCTFLTYAVIDALWVLLIPTCVPSSPTSIIVHHLFAIALIIVPWYLPYFGYHACLMLTVEINTVFLILKRNVRRTSIEFHITRILFYSTWIGQRLIMYPFLACFFYFEYMRYTETVGTYYNLVFIAPAGAFALSFLGYKWTFNMLFGKNKSKFAKVGKDTNKLE